MNNINNNPETNGSQETQPDQQGPKRNWGQPGKPDKLQESYEEANYQLATDPRSASLPTSSVSHTPQSINKVNVNTAQELGGQGEVSKFNPDQRNAMKAINQILREHPELEEHIGEFLREDGGIRDPIGASNRLLYLSNQLPPLTQELPEGIGGKRGEEEGLNSIQGTLAEQPTERLEQQSKALKQQPENLRRLLRQFALLGVETQHQLSNQVFLQLKLVLTIFEQKVNRIDPEQIKKLSPFFRSFFKFPILGGIFKKLFQHSLRNPELVALYEKLQKLIKDLEEVQARLNDLPSIEGFIGEITDLKDPRLKIHLNLILSDEYTSSIEALRSYLNNDNNNNDQNVLVVLANIYPDIAQILNDQTIQNGINAIISQLPKKEKVINALLNRPKPQAPQKPSSQDQQVESQVQQAIKQAQQAQQAAQQAPRSESQQPSEAQQPVAQNQQPQPQEQQAPSEAQQAQQPAQQQNGPGNVYNVYDEGYYIGR